MMGTIIAQLRKKQGIPQGKLSEEIGITQNYLSMIERNRKEPNLKLLKKIADRLGVPFQLILFMTLTEDDIPNEKKQLFGHLFEDVQSLISKDIF